MRQIELRNCIFEIKRNLCKQIGLLGTAKYIRLRILNWLFNENLLSAEIFCDATVLVNNKATRVSG